MPVYVYRNLVTNETFDYEQRITEDALTVDPRTGDPVRRVIQPVGIAFKGSGFYVNDSRSGAKSSSQPSDQSSAKSPDTGSGDASSAGSTTGADSAGEKVASTATASGGSTTAKPADKAGTSSTAAAG